MLKPIYQENSIKSALLAIGPIQTYSLAHIDILMPEDQMPNSLSLGPDPFMIGCYVFAPFNPLNLPILSEPHRPGAIPAVHYPELPMWISMLPRPQHWANCAPPTTVHLSLSLALRASLSLWLTPAAKTFWECLCCSGFLAGL